MIKRPLCLICILFLTAQAVRTVVMKQAEDQKPSALELAVSEENEAVLTGKVYRIEEKEKVTAVYLRDNLVSVGSRLMEEQKILVYVSRNQTAEPDKGIQTCDRLGIGNIIQVSGEAQAFEIPRNPGNFDQKFYYQKQGIHVLIWAETFRVRSERTDRLADFLHRLRKGWMELLLRHLGDYYGNTMCAVLLGEKSGMDDGMKKLYQKNGIAHILAISGLHMSFIGTGLYRILRRAGIPFALAGICGSVVLFFYTLMTGAGTSSLRALIMFVLRIGADITGRDYDLPTSLSLSAALLGAIQPLNLADAGYQLSFGAILGISLLEPIFSEMLGCGTLREKPGKTVQNSRDSGKAGRVLLKICKGLSASIAVNVLLLGPMLYFYFEIPPYSILLNLIVIPIMPVAMGAGISGSVIALIWDAGGGAVIKISGAVLFFYDRICEAASLLPGSRIVTGKPEIWFLVLYYFILFVFCCLFFYFREKEEGAEAGKDERKAGFRLAGMRLAGAAILLSAAGLTAACRMYNTGGGAQITVLDVGQGDGIYIRGASGRNFFVDGGSSSVSSVGTYRMESFLLSRASEHIDYAFLTHGDEDHINGIMELLQDQRLGIRIRNLVLPAEEYLDDTLLSAAETARENGTRVVTMIPGQQIFETKEGGGLVFTCLGPVFSDNAADPADESGLNAGNEASLVLDLSYGKFDMLLTGDVEGKGETLLLENGLLHEYDVLKAAHHGSRNSGSEEFLAAVRPVLAIISAGEENRYGHPHEETITRLKNAGSRIFNTAENGAVTVRTDGRTMSVELWISDHERTIGNTVR